RLIELKSNGPGRIGKSLKIGSDDAWKNLRITVYTVVSHGRQLRLHCWLFQDLRDRITNLCHDSVWRRRWGKQAMPLVQLVSCDTQLCDRPGVWQQCGTLFGSYRQCAQSTRLYVRQCSGSRDDTQGHRA